MAKEVLNLKLKEDWEYGVLGVYNYKKVGKLDEYFKHIFEIDKFLEGDIAEVGVYRGSSILATALYLKEIGSTKKVYGFDSFTGFPSYHKNDNLAKFDELFQTGKISKSLHDKISLNQKHRSLFLDEVTVENISSSGNFSENVYEDLVKKIKYLDLDNIILIKGNFEETMMNTSLTNIKFSSCLLDCDLYDGYKTSLPFVWERMVNGGYIFLDEYYSLKFPGAKIATDEFFMDKKAKPLQHKLAHNDFERWYVRKLS